MCMCVCVYKNVPAYLHVYYMCAMAVGHRGCQISLELCLQVVGNSQGEC